MPLVFAPPPSDSLLRDRYVVYTHHGYYHLFGRRFLPPKGELELVQREIMTTHKMVLQRLGTITRSSVWEAQSVRYIQVTECCDPYRSTSPMEVPIGVP